MFLSGQQTTKTSVISQMLAALGSTVKRKDCEAYHILQHIRDHLRANKPSQNVGAEEKSCQQIARTTNLEKWYSDPTTPRELLY